MKKILISLAILVALAVAGFLVWFVYTKDVEIVDTREMVVVSSPIKDSVISSPLSISGRARGTWFFEGSFPLILENEDGQKIAEGHVTAQGEWMTEDMVPFLGTLQFKKQISGTKGVLILRKDNPSGLPEHDDLVEVPVVFK